MPLSDGLFSFLLYEWRNVEKYNYCQRSQKSDSAENERLGDETRYLSIDQQNVYYYK